MYYFVFLLKGLMCSALIALDFKIKVCMTNNEKRHSFNCSPFSLSWEINYLSFSLRSLPSLDDPNRSNLTTRKAKVFHKSTTEPPSVNYMVVWISWSFFVFSEKKHENEEEQQFKPVNPLLLILRVNWKLKFWKYLIKRDFNVEYERKQN